MRRKLSAETVTGSLRSERIYPRRLPPILGTFYRERVVLMAGDGSTRTVLVIATDEALRKLLRVLFKSHGYEVELAFSAKEAARRLETSNFGAVIIDADARGENVVELLSSLDGRAPRLIALITGPLSVDHTRLRATLLKPFEIQRLTSIVDAAIHGTP